MKIENPENREPLYLKTPEEMCASKRFEFEGSDGASVYIPRNNAPYSGLLVMVAGVEYDDVLYKSAWSP